MVGVQLTYTKGGQFSTTGDYLRLLHGCHMSKWVFMGGGGGVCSIIAFNVHVFNL